MTPLFKKLDLVAGDIVLVLNTPVPFEAELSRLEGVTASFAERLNDPKSISVITYGELVYGARKSQREETNMARVRRIAEIFPIIDVSPAIVETFGHLKAMLEKTGSIVADLDLIIASTAITRNLILVTNNEKHFQKVHGLQVVHLFNAPHEPVPLPG
ncbi:MAG: type II toxin-antitoxin system VapC family toxin [Spirochaetaceae bacterium]|nr:MAG: type II toxin-antitoxin system VapC family toxin [Spirochaetaceae bacterium]